MNNLQACCDKCKCRNMTTDHQFVRGDHSCDNARCDCHTPPTTEKGEWERELLDLKCVNGAMYFGSVEDDSCNCKTRCQNEQTFEHATDELKSFIRTLLTKERERVAAAIEKHRREIIDMRSGLRKDVVLVSDLKRSLGLI